MLAQSSDCFNTQWVPGSRGSLRRPRPHFVHHLVNAQVAAPTCGCWPLDVFAWTLCKWGTAHEMRIPSPAIVEVSTNWRWTSPAIDQNARLTFDVDVSESSMLTASKRHAEYWTTSPHNLPTFQHSTGVNHNKDLRPTLNEQGSQCCQNNAKCQDAIDALQGSFVGKVASLHSCTLWGNSASTNCNSKLKFIVNTSIKLSGIALSGAWSAMADQVPLLTDSICIEYLGDLQQSYLWPSANATKRSTAQDCITVWGFMTISDNYNDDNLQCLTQRVSWLRNLPGGLQLNPIIPSHGVGNVSAMWRWEQHKEPDKTRRQTRGMMMFCLKALPPDLLDWITIIFLFTCLATTRPVTKWYNHGSDSAPCKRMCSDTFSLQCISLMRSMEHSRSYLGQPVLCALCNLHLGVMAESISDIRPLLTLYLSCQLTGRSCSGKEAIESKWHKGNAQHATNPTWVHNKMSTEYVDVLTCYDLTAYVRPSCIWGCIFHRAWYCFPHTNSSKRRWLGRGNIQEKNVLLY